MNVSVFAMSVLCTYKPHLPKVISVPVKLPSCRVSAYFVIIFYLKVGCTAQHVVYVHIEQRDNIMSNILKVFAHACFQHVCNCFSALCGVVECTTILAISHDVCRFRLSLSLFLFCTLLVGSKVCFGLEKHSGVVLHVQAVLIV